MTNTRQNWQDLAEKFLKGKPLESIKFTTADGLYRGPLSDSDDRPDVISALPRSGAPLLDGRPWHICAPARDPDIDFANTQILDDLKGGCSAVRLTLGQSGLNIAKSSDLRRALTGVIADYVPLILAPSNNLTVIDLCKDYQDAALCLGLAPDTSSLDAIIEELPQNWRALTLSTARIADSGGSAVEELAYLAAGTAYAFRRFGPERAAHNMGAELTTDQDAHINIAKIRAARRIYARIAQSFGQDQAPLSLHAITSRHMMQTQDPWTNMLRVMSAGFGAVIGGADFVTTRPFTDGLGRATPFGYRVARNMQVMMMSESHLGQVQDAAYGSYFHEGMTDKLAQAAWTAFQKIEGEGGFENIAPFLARVKVAAEARAEIADPILGVDLHPFEGKMPEVRS